MNLADALVTLLDTGTPSLSFDVKWTDDALAELADQALRTPQVWVVDSAENLLPASAAQNGCPIEEFELLLVIQRKLDADDDKPAEIRKLSLLAAEITRVCRRATLLDAACVQTQRKPARNLGEYHGKDLFYAEIITTWRRVFGEE
jgi:hypothetical protein